MKILGILGAHKRSGMTAKMLETVLQAVEQPNTVKIIYLEDLVIKPDIEGVPNPELDQIEKELLETDVWVFAAPTYWGTLSGVMKNLFDCLRQRLVRFDHTGASHPDRFKDKHYVSLTCCYTGAFENLISGVTDQTFKTIDKVMSAAGVIKVTEAVVTNTWGKTALSSKKEREFLAIGHKINNAKRRDDRTVKRYVELFFMVAAMSLITMLLQRMCSSFLSLTNFWFNYVSFTVIFFVLLAFLLHFVTFVKHRRH
ncbi:NAD(P)H-dependent oxidoreductase [Liquorilactobacillus oeni]|uniref:Flavin reductase n=1 Tax=Liquorilactobacillus oeni DSM 19972 TaxID=1423777 RepID=A0A0R1MJ31_9LACO|nr:NAD(P)H-dependent oxidoreductase [Liquorilactobacillus oeni]KRL04483.1 flavin reductase [Liquorilactobacillus oeni DSM 19972]